MEEYPELLKDFLLTRYRQGLDGMAGLDNVSDQKHLTAVNSMTVVSMIYQAIWNMQWVTVNPPMMKWFSRSRKKNPI